MRGGPAVKDIIFKVTLSLWCGCAPLMRTLHVKSFPPLSERQATSKLGWPIKTMLRQAMTQR